MSDGNTMGGERPRNANDAYYTPEALAHTIAGRVRGAFGDFGLVVEPSAGAGAFVRAARAAWPHAFILAVEPGLNDSTMPASKIAHCRWEQAAEAEMHTDAEQTFGGRSLVIGNPPFLLAEEHARLALDRMRDGDVLAFLLRASFLAGAKRVGGLWKQHPPAHVWHVAPRPSFTADGKTDGAEYAVIVWVRGHVGPYAGGWLEWSR